MSCHSKPASEPSTAMTTCEMCKEEFEEFTLLIWARKVSLINVTLCIKCDPQSLNRSTAPRDQALL